MKDFTGEEIEVGDLIIRAATWGSSPALEWAIVVDLKKTNDYRREIEKVGIISSGNERVGYTFPSRILCADEEWTTEETIKELKEKLEKYNKQK